MTEKRLKIALVSPPWIAVPPDGYGGTEAVIYHLAEGLVKQGHEVTLFASGDSRTSAELVSYYAKALGNEGELKKNPLLWLHHLHSAFKRAGEFDIFHNHAQYVAMFLCDLVKKKTRVVHTMHGSFAKGETPREKRGTLRRFKRHNFVSISNNQREMMPELNWSGTVYNGIDLRDFEAGDGGGGYLAWLGRITPKKGVVEAIEAAKSAGLKLKIAAYIDPVDKFYFESKVMPLIGGRQVEFVGELGKKERSEFLGRAKALLFPIKWHEPFGLVMIEAMACGTAVIAYDRGSVSEVVKDGVTGYIIKSKSEIRNPRQKLGFASHLDGQAGRRNSKQPPTAGYLRQRNFSSLLFARKKLLKEYKGFGLAAKKTAKNLLPSEPAEQGKIRKSGVEGLTEAIKRIGEIDRRACRRHVEENFTVEKMVEGYINIYKNITDK